MQPFYIVGPTGSGKSSIALSVAQRIGGEIVNADAFQLYQGLDVLTAKPTVTDMERVPHHLYGVVDPSDEMDAATYADLASSCIREISVRDNPPIVVGGSGLYVKALTHGLSTLPHADNELRAALSPFSLDELSNWLQRLDPDGAANMNLRNPRYVERALEISLLSGLPASELKAHWASQQPAFDGIFLEWEREALYERINQRTHKMIATGLLDEVKHLPPLSDTASKAIGIREMKSHLAGESSLEEAIEAMQQATRRYAKRQITWFRREIGFQSICLSSATDAKSAVAQILTMFPHLQPNQNDA